MTLVAGIVVAIVVLLMLATRRSVSSADRGLGYVSQRWLAEERATDSRPT